MNPKIRLLLVDNNSGDARIIMEMLKETKKAEFAITNSARLDKSLKLLGEEQFEMILLDLELPDSQGLETFKKISSYAPGLPVVILASIDDKSLALEAIKAGAQDCITKSEMNSNNLVRIVLYAIERKQAKEDLKESEKQLKEIRKNLQDVLDNSPDGILIADSNGRHRYANKRLSDIIEYNELEMLELTMKDITPADDLKKYAKMYKNRIKGEKTPNLYHRKVIAKSGKIIPVEMRTTTTVWEGEKCGLAFMTDITERKQIELKLKKSEEKLRLMIDKSPIGVSITDLNGKFIEVNPAVCNMIGYSSEEMQHKHFNQFSHPDDEAQNKELYEDLSDGKIRYFELDKRYIHKNGSVVYVHIRSQIVRDERGKPLFEMAITENVTERKQAEEQMKKRMNELEIFNEASVNREVTINELRKEINESLKQIGKEPKYDIVY